MKRLTIYFALAGILPCMAVAQALPGPADIDRVQPEPERPIPNTIPDKTPVPDVDGSLAIPDDAYDVFFELKEIKFEGMTAYSEPDVSDLYHDLLNKRTNLGEIMEVVGRLTERYRQDGYFLSRAYLPPQEITDGTVTIKVIEGYVGRIEADDPALDQLGVVKQLTKELSDKRPLRAQELESILLQINDLPGVNVRSIIEPLEDSGNGVVRLILKRQESKASGAVTAHNYGSRFIGPYQANASYENSFVDLHETQFYVATATEVDELKSAALSHQFYFAPRWNVSMDMSAVATEPGATLEQNDIESEAYSLGIKLGYQAIRQRQENLSFAFGLHGRNSNSDILGNNPLTRDRIRALRANMNYNKVDGWDGFNNLNLELSQGVDLLGASDESDANLSRAEADSEFTSLRLDYYRQQFINPDWLAVGRISGQLASESLLSAEEFGFGGQLFGRAYDPSALTGDHGIATSLEIRYLGLDAWEEFSFAPFGFYDVGKVWNEETGANNESASSAGFGIRTQHEDGFHAEIGIAFPLTREVDTPLYGNGDAPRYLFQIGHRF